MPRFLACPTLRARGFLQSCVLSHSVEVARGTVALFHYDSDSVIPHKIRLAPDTLFFTSRGLDFSAVGLESRLESAGHIPPSPGPAGEPEAPLRMIHHPRGRPKEVAEGCAVGPCDERYIRYEASSDYGSSGGALIDPSGHLVGIHVRGDHRSDPDSSIGEKAGQPEPWHQRYLSSKRAPPPGSLALSEPSPSSPSSPTRLCKALQIRIILNQLRTALGGSIPGEVSPVYRVSRGDLRKDGLLSSSALQSWVDVVPEGGRLLLEGNTRERERANPQSSKPRTPR